MKIVLYVKVFDGEIGDILMGQFCGSEMPATLTSSGSVVTIVFKSDGSSNFYGFGIVYVETDDPDGKNLMI